MESLRASIVVPSFSRPQLLRGCLAALATQRITPLEVLVVGREGDADTAAEAASALGPVRFLTVRVPGHLPPLAHGVAEAHGEVVAFVDDDAEPAEGWLEAILRHYARVEVGGVGGLVLQTLTNDLPPSDRIGIVSRLGRFDSGHHDRLPIDWKPREVDVLRGTNMSFRRSVLLEYRWDARLNGGAATDYEVDLCSFVRRQGLVLVYDPDAAVVHHLGPRRELGRVESAAAIRSYSHNLVYVTGKALPRGRALLGLLHAFLVGNRLAYGLGAAATDTLLGRPPSWNGQLRPALSGKLAGLTSLARYARRGAAPLP